MDANANLNENVLMEKTLDVMSRDVIETLISECKGDVGENACKTAFKFYQCYRE